MKLSIIVPMYRVERYIERCLKSIGTQEVEGGVECLIIDDCSPDNSRAVAEKFISDYSGAVQFRILSHSENKGQSCARNLGIENAKGDYIIFVDSDDYLADNVLEPIVKRMDGENLDLLCYRVKDVRNGVDVTHCSPNNHPKKNTMMSNIEYLNSFIPIYSPCMHIARREKVNDILFSPYTIHEDYAYMLKVFSRIDRIGFDNTFVYFYDIKESNTTTTTRSIASNRKFIADWISELVMLHDYINSNNFSPELKRVFHKCLTDFHYTAFTCLITKEIPFEEKLNYYRQFRLIPNMFKYAPNHLDFKRKLRLMLFCAPGGFRLILQANKQFS